MKGQNKSNNAYMPILITISMILLLFFISFFASTSNNQQSYSDANSSQGEKQETEEVERIYETKETESIPFDRETIEDGNLEYGTRLVSTAGQEGTKTITYSVTYDKDGNESTREKIGEEITKHPVAEITSVGTKIIWRCYDATSYDRNPYNDNRCVSSTGETRYVSDSQSRDLDPTYSPGQDGHWYYNSK